MFYYISKDSLTNGSDITIIFQTESAIPNYKQITNFGELVEYQGDNIPNQWEFDGTYFYALTDKPSPYHKLNENKEWVVSDIEGFKTYCLTRIDEIKAKILEYGFDYAIDGTNHRQRCRDKDIAYMTSTVVGLQIAKQVLNKDLTKTWYFQDNHGEVMDLVKISTLMMYGMSFVQSVFDTESYFKKLETPKIVSKEEFETKRKEIHEILAGAR